MPSRRRRYRARPKKEVPKPPSNSEITAPKVRLIGAEGEQMGVVATSSAKEKAAKQGLDLIVVAQKSDPPVVRMADLGKHMYEQRKKMAKQKAKSKGGDIKGIRISFKISPHDQEIRIRQAESFLEEGNKVKVEMRLRGREKGRPELARKKLQEFVSHIPGAQIEGSISGSPNNISAIVSRQK